MHAHCPLVGTHGNNSEKLIPTAIICASVNTILFIALAKIFFNSKVIVSKKATSIKLKIDQRAGAGFL